MKRRLLLLLVLVLAAGWIIWRSKHQSPLAISSPASSSPTSTAPDGEPAAAPVIGQSDVANAVPAVSPAPLSSSPTAPAAASTPPTSSVPTKEEPSKAAATESGLETLRIAVRLYGSMFGGNPVGTNTEITRALLGANPKKARLLDDYRLNDQGELIDVWGTPFFFHQISGHETEICSAGPDGQMWTSDDVVIR